ncbi:hypothetical protein [Roseibium sp. MMSF_3544]|nr:hypothetical protein [Roseibium sp. MMSF_3544]
MHRYATKHMNELRQEIENLLNRRDLDPAEKSKRLDRLDRSYQFWRQFA